MRWFLCVNHVTYINSYVTLSPVTTCIFATRMPLIHEYINLDWVVMYINIGMALTAGDSPRKPGVNYTFDDNIC